MPVDRHTPNTHPRDTQPHILQAQPVDDMISAPRAFTATNTLGDHSCQYALRYSISQSVANLVDARRLSTRSPPDSPPTVSSASQHLSGLATIPARHTTRARRKNERSDGGWRRGGHLWVPTCRALLAVAHPVSRACYVSGIHFRGPQA